MDYYAFYTGQCFDAYRYLGAHRSGEEWVFRTFAPSAAGVVLLHGGRELPMERIHDGNFYEVRAEGVQPGDCYQYRIYRRDGGYTDHCDPYGYGMELRPDHCSVVRDLGTYTFQDEKWMAGRTDRREDPLNIYELHLGSWRRRPDGSWYRYDELAQPLIDYVRECGYNYVEFLPISEHPCDESWGYQITGFYAPTSRYGTARELMMLIDRLHQAGIADPAGQGGRHKLDGIGILIQYGVHIGLHQVLEQLLLLGAQAVGHLAADLLQRRGARLEGEVDRPRFQVGLLHIVLGHPGTEVGVADLDGTGILKRRQAGIEEHHEHEGPQDDAQESKCAFFTVFVVFVVPSIGSGHSHHSF